MSYKKDTICVQGGYRPKSGESRIPPISQSTTYFYDSTQGMADLFDLKADGYFYSRLANPTVAAFEGKVTELEGGAAAVGCSSGMAASTLAAFTVCCAGDNIVSSSAIYGGTFNLFAVTLPKLGIETRFFDPDAPAEEIEKLIDDKTKSILTYRSWDVLSLRPRIRPFFHVREKGHKIDGGRIPSRQGRLRAPGGWRAVPCLYPQGLCVPLPGCRRSPRH